jgi:hypothetical protein
MKRYSLIVFYGLLAFTMSFGRDCPVPDFAEAPAWIEPNKVIGDLLCARQGTKAELEQMPAVQLEGCDPLDDDLNWSFTSDEVTDFGVSGEPNMISLAPDLPQQGIVYIYATLSVEGQETVGTLAYNIARPAPIIIPHCGGT